MKKQITVELLESGSIKVTNDLTGGISVPDYLKLIQGLQASAVEGLETVGKYSDPHLTVIPLQLQKQCLIFTKSVLNLFGIKMESAITINQGDLN